MLSTLCVTSAGPVTASKTLRLGLAADREKCVEAVPSDESSRLDGSVDVGFVSANGLGLKREGPGFAD